MRRLLTIMVAMVVSATVASATDAPEQQKPLYVVDGKAMTVDEVQRIAATDIESMTVLKQAAQTKEFMHLGDVSNGVVVITLKASREAEDELPFLEADVMPTFMGGDLLTFRNWVMQNVRYPAEALERRIEGNVIVQFVVNREGYIAADGVKVLQSDHQLLSEEVIRMMSLSPRWSPGIQAGKTVSVAFTLPISFQIPESEGGSGNPNGKLFIEGDKVVVQVRNSTDKHYFGNNTPIYIIDGLPATTEEVKALPSEQILRVALLDDEEMLAYYKDFGDVSNGVVIIHTKSSDEEVVDKPDSQPSFMGGDWNTFHQWLMQNIRYPMELAEKGVSAHLVVKFVVNSQGYVEVTDISTIKGTAHPLFHEEVNRVMNKSPRWSPAMLNGKAVACQGIMPIIFGTIEM
ncbi:MAG: TonB family protein [Alistipes sp.]|nr:TonB family protein [Alistipes sp.]